MSPLSQELTDLLRLSGNENIQEISALFLNNGSYFEDDKNAESGFEEERVFVQILSKLKKRPASRLLYDVARIG